MAYIYLIGSEGSPLKIGLSENPHKRMREIQTGHPRRVSLYAAWEHGDARSVEREAHRLLAFRRLSGEWFSVSRREAVEAVEQAIRNIADAGALFAELAPESPPEETIIPLPKPLLVAPTVARIDALPAVVPEPAVYGPTPPFRLAYVRGVGGPPTVAQQAAEAEGAGVDPRDIWIETGESREFFGMMKDLSRGDILVVWSADVVGGAESAAGLRAAADERNAFVEFLHV